MSIVVLLMVVVSTATVAQSPDTAASPDDTSSSTIADDTSAAPVDSMTATDTASDATSAPLADAARAFVRSCAGCHTIGGGDLEGPDLKPVATWPTADIAAAVGRMQKQVGQLSDEQIAGFVALLQDPTAGEHITAAQEAVRQSFAADLDPGSASIGRQLFTGERALKNNGMACIGCHRVSGSGGTLAISLHDVYSRLGETALTSGIQGANYPVMDRAYAAHAITAQETAHLVAYFKAIDSTTSPDAAPPAPGDPIGLPATLAAASVVALMAFYYRNRHIRTSSNRRGMK